MLEQFKKKKCFMNFNLTHSKKKKVLINYIYIKNLGVAVWVLVGTRKTC